MRIHPHDLLAADLVELLQKENALAKHLEECHECQERLRSLRAARPEPALRAKILRWPEAASAGGPVAELPAKPRGLGDGIGDELLAELIGRPQSDRIFLIRSDRRLQSFAALRRLIELGLEQASLSPALEEDLAHLALDLAGILEIESSEPLLLEDLRARAWASIGNARRLQFDLAAADKAFEQALSHLRLSASEPESRALVLRLLASLRRDQRRLDDALRLLEQALGLLEEIGDTPGSILVLVKISTLYEHGGQPDLAIESLWKALERLGPEPADIRLLLQLKHNVATFLAVSGRVAEAVEMFTEIQDLYELFQDPWTQNRRAWLEARICRGLGDPARAESFFLAARQGFFAQGSAYDAALVSLELAALYAQQGRTEDVTRIAVEIFPIFSSQRIDQEVRATLALLDLTPLPS